MNRDHSCLCNVANINPVSASDNALVCVMYYLLVHQIKMYAMGPDHEIKLLLH